MLKYINKIDCCETSGGDIPGKIIKMVQEELIVTITNCVNKCISLSTFPDDLKTADVMPVSKKPDVGNKTNYQPISLLPIIEKLLYSQLETIANKIFFTKTMCIQKR